MMTTRVTRVALAGGLLMGGLCYADEASVRAHLANAESTANMSSSSALQDAPAIQTIDYRKFLATPRGWPCPPHNKKVGGQQLRRRQGVAGPRLPSMLWSLH